MKTFFECEHNIYVDNLNKEKQKTLIISILKALLRLKMQPNNRKHLSSLGYSKSRYMQEDEERRKRK
jgi:hypothetical protein